MKTKLSVFAIVLVAINLVSAQEEKSLKVAGYILSNVTISSGKGALTSGFDTQFGFSKGPNDILFLQANNDRICLNIGKKFGNFKLIESIAVFKNIPWTGPMVIYQWKGLDLMAWNGVGFAKDNTVTEPSYKPQFFFSYESIGLSFANYNRIGASVMWFGTQPVNWFASYKRIIPLGEQSKLFAEVTYNHNLDIPMFVIGYNLKLK